ncbi:MAG: hypothetical protein IJZ44_02195 [Lachnospiraceae bacterium]|nr:hypothetical protein [Lachnospiraceae bacterium]
MFLNKHSKSEQEIRRLYQKNKGQLIFEVCYHFSWDANKEIATNLLEKNGNKYCCVNCGHCIKNEKEYRKMNELVSHVNGGGRDDKRLMTLYGDIELLEWAVVSPTRLVENGARCKFSSDALKRSFGFCKKLGI